MDGKPTAFELFSSSTNETFSLSVTSTMTTQAQLDWLVKALTSFREFLPTDVPQDSGPAQDDGKENQQ